MKWNESLEKQEIDKDYDFIFQNAIQNEHITAKNFTNYANYARIMLLFSDKNRSGAYSFKYADYLDRQPVFYPSGYTG